MSPKTKKTEEEQRKKTAVACLHSRVATKCCDIFLYMRYDSDVIMSAIVNAAMLEVCHAEAA